MTRTKKPGRPKGSRNQSTIVREVGRMLTTISEGGSEERVPIAEAVVRLLERRAMTGDIAADKALARLKLRMVPAHEQEPATLLLAPEPLKAAEWIRQQEILNHLRETPEEAGEPSGASSDPKPPGGGSGSATPVRPSPPHKPPRPSMRGKLYR